MTSLRKLFLLTIAGAAAFSVAACTDLFDPDNRDVEVSITMQRAWNPPPVFQADIGGHHVAVTGQVDGGRSSRTTQAPRSGDLPVIVRLLGADGHTIASTQYTQRFERGSTHWVAIDVGPRRPLGICIGTLLALATDSPTDTVFVMHGSIPEGAIC